MKGNNISEYLAVKAETWKEEERARARIWGHIPRRDSYSYVYTGSNKAGQEKARQLAVAWVHRQIEKALGQKAPAGWKERGRMQIRLRSDYRVQVTIWWGYRQHQKKVILEKNTGLDFEVVAQHVREAMERVRDRQAAKAEATAQQSLAGDAIQELAELAGIKVADYNRNRASGPFHVLGRELDIQVEGDDPDHLMITLRGLDPSTAATVLSRMIVDPSADGGPSLT